VTKPFVQRMDRSWCRMARVLPSLIVQPEISGTYRSSTTTKGTGTIGAPSIATA